MSKFKWYRKKGVQLMRPIEPGEDLSGVSVSSVDADNLEGGMIAVNPNDPRDKWFVAKQFFEDNYEYVSDY